MVFYVEWCMSSLVGNGQVLNADDGSGVNPLGVFVTICSALFSFQVVDTHTQGTTGKPC